MTLTQAIDLVNKQHPAQGLIEELQHLGSSLTDVLTDQVRGGVFDDVGRQDECHVVKYLARLFRRRGLAGFRGTPEESVERNTLFRVQVQLLVGEVLKGKKRQMRWETGESGQG